MLVNLFDYESIAPTVLPDQIYGYYAGGAGDNVTVRLNREAFDRIALRPRVLRDVSTRSMTTEILGSTTEFPVIIAPTAMARLARRDGELGIARAAQAAGVIQCLSTLSNTSLESVAQVGATNWFQLYMYRDRGITRALVERAIASGFKALVLTVDAPVPGIRESLVRHGLSLPADLSLENFDGIHDTSAASVLPYVRSQLDPAVTWNDLELLVRDSDIPVIVKGVLRGDDAKRVAASGGAAMIVSNHGGRQLDTSIAAIEALPEVVDGVEGSIPVLMDGGVRRGTDILKAIARGAAAVLVGRPIVWGLAVSGESGVSDVIAILRHEFDVAMALCGCASTREIDSDLLAG